MKYKEFDKAASLTAREKMIVNENTLVRFYSLLSIRVAYTKILIEGSCEEIISGMCVISGVGSIYIISIYSAKMGSMTNIESVVCRT